jgi:hypothetical protein
MKGECAWCGHKRRIHLGPALKLVQEFPNIKWTMTACTTAGCMCRKYEIPRNKPQAVGGSAPAYGENKLSKPRGGHF